jgi:hypothetical protein
MVRGLIPCPDHHRRLDAYGSGPYAGAHRAWTASGGACVQLDEATWVADHLDRDTVPALVTVVAARADDGSMLGSVQVGFGSADDMTTYTDLEPSVLLEGDGVALMLILTSTNAMQRFTAEGETADPVSLVVRVTCPADQ